MGQEKKVNDKIGQENAHVGEGKKESGGECVFEVSRNAHKKKKKESKKKTSGERSNARYIYIKKRNRER